MVDINKVRKIITGVRNEDDVIVSDAKKNHRIIYGRRALNAQLPLFLSSVTRDWDIYTTTPRKVAYTMQGRLDRVVAKGKDFYYAVKPAKHSNTWRVMSIGPDFIKRSADDLVVVDYTLKPSKLETVRIGGLLYERLSSIEKGKRRTLKDTASSYRHEKDRFDIQKIRLAKDLRRQKI